MALKEKREMAIILRKQELSYSEIKQRLRVSKSTLSLWLRDYPLSKERINQLRGNNEKRIEKYRETRRKIRQARLDEYYKNQKEKIFPLNRRDIFIAGLFLYWGEGSKSTTSEVFVSNTNPAVINFFINWLEIVFNVSRSKIVFKMHFYQDMDIEKEISFWVHALNVSRKQFVKPYIKKTYAWRINEKGSFGHGTCNAGIYNTRMHEEILMALKSIADSFNTMVP